MFALVDCNSFYVSCEKAFRPHLKTKPVVVLSNNDGCIISRSQEAKAIGIGMAEPLFKCEHLIKKYGVEVFSANFVLYGDMSDRIMSILSRFTSDMEIYSIDEAFLLFEDSSHLRVEETARNLREMIKKTTSIPVSIGIASTKTLAKLGNHFAKDHPETGGVCLIKEEEIDKYLLQTPIREIWGIGKEKEIFLKRNGITNALELKNAQDDWIKKHLTITTLRTVWELRGIPCIALEEAVPSKKAIGTSRTFGYEVQTFEEIEEAVSAYTSHAAHKLRKQGSMAQYIQVYIESNPFKDGPYYRNSAGTRLMPTAYTPKLIEIAKGLAKKIYREGWSYKKCGIILSDFLSKQHGQSDFFEASYENSAKESLMRTIDHHNAKREIQLFWASEGIDKPWFMKQARKSQCFTTRWNELLEIRI